MNIESLLSGAEYHYTINEADVATDKYNTDGQVQQNGKLGECKLNCVKLQ